LAACSTTDAGEEVTVQKEEVFVVKVLDDSPPKSVGIDENLEAEKE